MISIRKKLAPLVEPPTTEEPEHIPYPQVTSVLPEMCRDANNPPVIGHEFNLVRIVEEHGPKRISAIEKEIAKLENKIATLVQEKKQIAAFVSTLGAP